MSRFRLRVILPHRRQQLRQPSKEPEEELPSALNQPLSLEQSAICCIVTNLEKYPPDVLALLPLRFRRELLLLLPPADIFQLEQTKVVDGIDMDNEIWKVVSERYDYKVAHTAHCNENVRTYTSHSGLMIRSRRGSSCRQLPLPSGIKPDESSSPQLISWKARFVSCLVSFLFYMTPLQLSTDHADMCDRYSKCFGWRNYVVLLQLLFCNQFFKLKQLTDVGGFPLQVSEVTLLPSRYSRFFISLVPPSEWVRFFLEKCLIQPPHSITIDLQQFNIESGTTFQRFLSNAKNLKLFLKSVESSNADQPTTEEELLDKVARLCSMLTSSHQLENMSIAQHVSYVRRGCIVRRVIDQSQFNKVLQNCFFHPLFVEHSINHKHLDLFRGLKRIDITGYKTVIELSTLCSLFVFTQNHNFESVSVSGPFVRCDPHQKEIVLQALVQSFTSPISSTCTLISLTDIAQLPFSFLFWLVRKFLYSPSTVPQKMVISSCHIDYTTIPSEKELDSIPKPPNLDDSHKSLQFSRLTLKHAFVEALARLPSLFLDELHIDHSCYLYDSVTADVLCALLLTIPIIPVCRIKSLSLQFDMSRARKVYRASLVSYLSLCDSNLIGTLFKMAQKVPETAVSLQCGTASKYTELLLGCLHNDWKKNGGNVKLDQLLIHLSDSFARTPGFRSSIEASLMVYPIHEIATNVDIRDKGNGSSIFELESSDN